MTRGLARATSALVQNCQALAQRVVVAKGHCFVGWAARAAELRRMGCSVPRRVAPVTLTSVEDRSDAVLRLRSGGYAVADPIISG